MERRKSEKNREPLVSICVLTYMHQKYVEDCIKGIMCQIYKNIEIIMLDDGSADDTLLVLQKYKKILEKKYSRVLLKQNKKNVGNISQNTNWLIKNARGKYLTLLSGDDIIRKNFLNQMVHQLEMHPDKIMCYANAYVVDDDFQYGDKPGNCYFFYRHRPYDQKDIFPQLMKLCYISPAVLIRRCAYTVYGEYDETIRYEDYDMWLRIGKEEEFLYWPQKLEFYRRSSASKTNYRTKGGKARLIWMAQEEQKVIKKHLQGLSYEERKRYIQYFYDRFIWAAKDARLWGVAMELAIKKKHECKENRKI